MDGEKILKGVPKVFYGAFGGITPFPICLKAVSDYLGDELDYTYAIVACGGAFRFAWNTKKLDGGNVDIALAYNDHEYPYRNGVESLGRSFRMLWRGENAWGHEGNGTKNDFKAFIKEQIDKGRPLISLGPVGPAEAGIITGYRNDGDTLLGWSLFQCDDSAACSEEGYFISDKWYEQGDGDFIGIMALGDITGARFGTKEIVKNAIAALEGRQEGDYAKGIAAYEAWKNALLNAKDSDFAMIPDWGQSLAVMCQGDATDCLIDGRKNACKYFMGLAKENPGQLLYARIAEQFGIVAKGIHENIYGVLGGHERGIEQMKKLEKPEVRSEICKYIDDLKAADEKALSLMKALLLEI